MLFIESYFGSLETELHEHWLVSLASLVFFIGGLVLLSMYLSRLAPTERSRQDKRSAWKRKLLIGTAVGLGIGWLLLLPTHSASSYLIPFLVNVIFLIIVAGIYKTREWSADDFFRLALMIVIWTSTCSAFSLHRDDLSWHSFAGSFLESSAVYFGLWALYGIWLTIYTARLRQGQAMSYDFMLTHISELFERTLTAARRELSDEFNRLNDLDKAIEIVADRHQVKMVLFTPSNGNVSCDRLSKYEAYRDKLLAFAAEREVTVQLICLSEAGIGKYYQSYYEQATDAAEQEYTRIACAEAICLFRKLQEINRDNSKHFSLLTKDTLDGLLPEHLIAAPLEAWLWVPHRGPRRLGGTVCDLPDWFTSSPDEDSRFETAKTELQKAAKKRIKPRRLECLAFRTEDTIARHEITSWIADTIKPATTAAATP